MSKVYCCRECGQWFYDYEVEERDEYGNPFCPCSDPHTHLKCGSEDVFEPNQPEPVAPRIIREPEQPEIPGFEKTSDVIKAYKKLTPWRK